MLSRGKVRSLDSDKQRAYVARVCLYESGNMRTVESSPFENHRHAEGWARAMLLAEEGEFLGIFAVRATPGRIIRVSSVQLSQNTSSQ